VQAITMASGVGIYTDVSLAKAITEAQNMASQQLTETVDGRLADMHTLCVSHSHSLTPVGTWVVSVMMCLNIVS
jgi:hypothetical protein